MSTSDAVGLLETQGLVAALHATDDMLKSSNVTLVGKEKIGAAYVTIVVRGDVAAVQTAIATGKQTVERLGGKLILADVIPRPLSRAGGPAAQIAVTARRPSVGSPVSPAARHRLITREQYAGTPTALRDDFSCWPWHGWRASHSFFIPSPSQTIRPHSCFTIMFTLPELLPVSRLASLPWGTLAHRRRPDWGRPRCRGGRLGHREFESPLDRSAV